MEGQIPTSENNNNLESSKNVSTSPKFQDIVDIKNYYNKNINDAITNKLDTPMKSQKVKLKFCCKKIGHTLCLLSDKMGNPIIMIGPHWPMYACFCGFVTLGYFSFFYHFFKILNIFFKVFGISSYGLYFISYTGTFLLNPGYPERNENSLVGKPRIKYKYCIECDIWIRIDKSVSHCPECGVCVEGYDHHCPWTGKCIGRKTINYFYTFITSVFIIFLYFVSALIFIDLKEKKPIKI